MGRYYLHRQEDRQWLCYLSGPMEGYNSSLFLQLQHQSIDGVLPVTLREEARGRIFLYEIGDKVSLSSLLANGITEERLLKLLLGVVGQAVHMIHQGLGVETLLWSTQCIFEDPLSGQLGFIVDYRKEKTITNGIFPYIKGMITEAKIYNVQFIIARRVLDYIDDYKEDRVEQFFCFLQELYQQFFSNREYSGYLTLTSRLDEKGIHIEDFAQMFHNQHKGSTHTGEVYLIRARTNERIPIVKEAFYIGKEASAVDYCIHDNAAVSRSHACIVSKDSRFFIKDLGSTNRTYVNNLEVTCNQLQELRPGYRITLANEVFYFH